MPDQPDATTAAQGGSSPSYCSAVDTSRLTARMEGATAALDGKKLGENHYPEEDERHFYWLAGWTDVRMDRMKHGLPNI